MSNEAWEFKQHIIDVTNHLQDEQGFSEVVSETVNTGSSACVDKFCKKGPRGSGMFPGALIGMDNLGIVDGLYRELRDAGAVDLDVFVHLHCGYLFTYLNLSTLEDQRKYVDSSKLGIERYAKKSYGLRINWRDGGENGTAKPFMD